MYIGVRRALKPEQRTAAAEVAACDSGPQKGVVGG